MARSWSGAPTTKLRSDSGRWVTTVTRSCASPYNGGAHEIAIVLRRLDDSVISRGQSPRHLLNRFAAATAATVILIVTILPGCAAICCVTQQTTEATFMASMPCCADMPSVLSPESSAVKRTAMLTASPKLPALSSSAAVAPLPISTANPSQMFAVAENALPRAASVVPAFLRNEQFRI